MNFLFAQIALISFNFWNAIFDAYVILDNKKIAHAINFSAYLLFACICVYLYNLRLHWLFGFLPYGEGLLFIISAFFNRQLSFDITINLRRGLPWYYQSAANPPKAIMDRIERVLFGNGKYIGKNIAWFYFACYCVCVNIKIWLM